MSLAPVVLSVFVASDVPLVSFVPVVSAALVSVAPPVPLSVVLAAAEVAVSVIVFVLVMTSAAVAVVLPIEQKKSGWMGGSALQL